MDFLGAIVGIAVLVGIGWAISKGRDAFWRGASQKILMRKSHAEGRELVTEPIEFMSRSHKSDIFAAVKEAVALPNGPQSRLVGDLFIESETDGAIVFASGTRLGTSFRSVLALSTEGGTTAGAYQVLNWTESDGIVSEITQLKYLRRKILEVVQSQQL